MGWFDKRRRAPDTLSNSEVVAADGHTTVIEHTDERALKDAYDRGRRDERARRPGFSLVSVAVLMAAVVGGGALYLAVKEGSFSQGGAVVDHTLSSASDTVQAPVRGAADKAGAALENAGQNLKDKAGKGDAPSK